MTPHKTEWTRLGQTCTPCPFCGGKELRIIRPSPNGKAVWCRGCGASGPVREDTDGAIEAWSNRLASDKRP